MTRGDREHGRMLVADALCDGAARDQNLEGIEVSLRLEGARPRSAGEGSTGGAAAPSEAPRVRAINFHNTPESERPRYAAQLEGLGERYGPVDEAGLHALFEGRSLPHGRPGLLPVFYEGYRNTYEVALELVEREGLVAWLFVPSAFPGTPSGEQHAFAAAHAIDLAGGDPERVAMSWDELRDVVARGHVVACHTATHTATADVRSPEAERRELTGSKATLERELGVTVSAFAWLWGSPVGVATKLDARLAEAGYHFVFSNAMIQRLEEMR